ncbi:MAG TPA: serine/threonine-protein kinase, partial [Pseudonocardiaceae bacterium]|nr:serine/threonine-protein kinase [Pseudonocardiaceae bacterium]
MSATDTGGRGLGRRIAGRYRLTRLINSGGSGSVWAAVDEVLGREVAIKDVAASPYLDGPDRRAVPEHTLREARAAGRINHPGVVLVHDVVEHDGRPWIVLQLVDAPSLAALVERDGPLAPHHAAVIGLQLAGALRAAHARGVTHRDVKPSNVLIDGDRVVLTDFGIAMIEGEAALCPPGTLVGAPSYIAPECVRGAPATPASDLWALGATLYAAVEGRAPFHRDDPIAALAATATGEPDPPGRAGVLTALLTRLLHREPGRRPDAAQVENDLRRLVAAIDNRDEPVADPPRPARRSALSAAAAVIIALVTGLVSPPHQLDDGGRQPRPSLAQSLPADAGPAPRIRQPVTVTPLGAADAGRPTQVHRPDPAGGRRPG